MAETFTRRTRKGKIAIVRNTRRRDNNNLRNGALALGSTALLGGILLSLRGKPSRLVLPVAAPFKHPDRSPRSPIQIPKDTSDLSDINAVRKNLNDPNHVWEFGYACGSTFIPDSAKCYTDPRTRARLRVPLTKAQVERARSKSPGAEKLYSAQEQAIKGRLRGGVIPPEYQAAARSVGATKVLPSGIAEVDPKKLNLDPKRFQYKIVSGATGESGSLTDVKK